MLAFCAARSQNTASFVISEIHGCNGALYNVNFYDNSTGDDAVVQRDWNLGNGTIISSGPDMVTSDYLSIGKYYISLTVTFANGDVKTKTDSVMVHEEPMLGITGENNFCLTATNRLQYTGNVTTTEAVAGYKWQIDGDSVAGTKDLDIEYRIPGTHTMLFSVRMESGCVYSTFKTIVVDYIATYFGMTTGRYCGSGTVTFSNYSINIYPLTGYLWSYGDGTFSTNKEESHTYTAPGRYTVKLVATSMSGCVDSTTFVDTVTVLTIPTATINGPSTVCLTPSSTLQYTNSITTVDVIRQYKWAIDGNTVANIPNLNYDYRVPGTHELAYTIKSSRGCETTVTKTIMIDSIRTAFSTSARLLCTDSIVKFGNPLRNYGTADYTWSFGDGETVLNKDTISHTYAPGIYTSKLYGETVNGCKDSTRVVIKVSGPWTVAINGDSINCLTPGTKLQYKSIITGNETIAKYKWLIDGDSVSNAANLDHDYRKAGTHTLTLIVTSAIGCELTATKKIVIDSVKTGFSMSRTKLCGDSTIQFKNLSAVASTTSYTWSFGDGTVFAGNQTAHDYTVPGSYSVKLYAESVNGCKDSTVLVDTIKVFAPVTVAITGNTIACLRPLSKLQYNGSVTSTDVITKYKWTIDNDSVANTLNLNYNYRKSGSHVLALTVNTASGCDVTAYKTIIIDSVKTNFSIDKAKLCGESTVDFINLSKSFAPVTYRWAFGDGTSYTGKDTAHNYITAGSYSVTLYEETVNGCKDSTVFTDTIKLFSKPVVAIAGDSIVCLTPSTKLQYSSTINSVDAITKYKWTIDGNSVATTANLDLNYRQAGKHTLSLDVTTSNGCTATVLKAIVIDSVKTAFEIDAHKFCGSGTVNFVNKTKAGTTPTYTWQFGDGTTFTGETAIHNYNSTGLFSLKLNAVTTNGCTDSTVFKDTIRISAKPKISIDGDSVHCTAGSYIYTALSAAIENIDIFKWYVDGTPAGNTGTLEHYFNAGSHSISLKVISVNGCTDSTVKQIAVDAVKAGFNVSENKFCAEKATVQFTNTTTATGLVTKYEWRFGDGSTASDENPAHTYQQPGQYDVTLIVSTANGCTDTITAVSAITISSKPAAAVTGELLHCKTGTFAYNAVTTGNAASTNYQWTVNGSLNPGTSSLNYNFSTAGIYNIILIAATGTCTDTSELAVTVDTVSAAFKSSDTKVCGENGTIQFSNLSAAAFANETYTWNFDDGKTSNEKEPQHNFAPGKYVPTLQVTTAKGCTASFIAADTIKIYSVKATIEGDTEKCAGSSMQFKAAITTDEAVTNYTWKLNNAVAGSGNNLSYEFKAAGTYTLSLEINTAAGCAAAAGKTITIHALPVPNASADTTVCKGSTIYLHSQDGTTYQWQPATLLQNANTAAPAALIQKEGDFYVTVTNQYGCSQKDTVHVNADEPVNLVVDNDKTICTGSNVQLKASANAVGYLWNNETTLNNKAIAAPVAQPSATTIYQVIAFSGNSCKNDTAGIKVSVGNIPTVNAGENKTVEANSAVQLNAVSSNNESVQFTWTNSEGLSCSNCSNPSFTAVKDITYTVTVKTTYGCTASDDIFIKVMPAKAHLYMPSAFSPNNDRLNDFFYVKGYGLVTVKSMIIFNRLGQKVFEKQNVPANDPSLGWNGDVNGEPAGGNESFIYIVVVIDKDGKEQTLKGTVTIVK
ncbi:MAG: PKD domain-containing protein [Ferruginibacter sp.]